MSIKLTTLPFNGPSDSSSHDPLLSSPLSIHDPQEFNPSSSKGEYYDDNMSEEALGDEAGDVDNINLHLGKNAVKRHRRQRRVIILLSILLVMTWIILPVHVYNPDVLKRVIALGKINKFQCLDPYTELGYIWRGEKDADIRWIPYDVEDPGLSSTMSISPSIDPPPEALERATEPFNQYLTKDNRSSDGRLDFMKGRTVVFVGDSHDRNNVDSFCHQHPRTIHKVPGGHLKSSCQMPDLNFTLASWFHYGMAEEEQTWYMRGEGGPWGVEERLSKLFIPDIENIGYPSLIVLNSFYWDVRYLARYAVENKHAGSLMADERAFTYGELAWHRQRLRTYVNVFRTAFPGIPIMFRLGQVHATSRNDGNVGVYQMNRSIRAVMASLGVPIFEWATLLSGETHYTDDQHLAVGKPAWLLGQMMAFYLKRAVEGVCF